MEIKITPHKKKSGGGAKKIGRNIAFCKKYELEGRKAKNKRKRLSRHVRRQPNDLRAQRVFKML